VTPLSPAQWSVTFDGESVSLWPSIGNHDLSCRSHYVIRRNQVRWARSWTSHEAEAGRRADLRDLKAHFGVGALDEVTAAPQATLTKEGLFTRLVRRFLRR
jgi:hypothetical protein